MMDTKEQTRLKFPTSDYLIYWDRRRKAAIIATGRFRGKTWCSDHDSFFDRTWHYVGVLDGHRVKRINHFNGSFAKAISKGLRRVFLSTIQDMPKEFRDVPH